MNKLICLLLLLFCQQSFCQSTDSINIKIKKLRVERERVNNNLINLKKEASISGSNLTRLDDRYNNMLVNLDSLTGVSISLENKNKRSKAEEQKLLSVKKKQDSIKSSLIQVMEQREQLQQRQEQMKEGIKSLSFQVSQLDKQMQQLEKLRH